MMATISKRRSFYALQKSQDRHDQLEKEYLRSHGWGYTCQTPGSFWLWQKQLSDGRILLVNQKTAIHLESSGELR